MKTVKNILIVLLALLVLAAGGGAYGAYRVSQLDTNYPNLSVNGIPVGGLTREQTVDALNAAGWETRLSTPLTVTTLGGQSFTVDPLKSGVLQATEGIAEMAFLVLGATVLGYFLIPVAMKTLHATTVSIYTNLQPIVASMVAIFVGQDFLSWDKIVAAALVLLSAYIVTNATGEKD